MADSDPIVFDPNHPTTMWVARYDHVSNPAHSTVVLLGPMPAPDALVTALAFRPPGWSGDIRLAEERVDVSTIVLLP